MTSTGTSLQTFVNALVGLANSIIPLLLAVAVIVFIWGVIRFLSNPASPEEHSNMKSFLIWGIIAITVILSIWGIATMLKNTLFPSVPCPIGVSGCNGASSNQSNTPTGSSYYPSSTNSTNPIDTTPQGFDVNSVMNP